MYVPKFAGALCANLRTLWSCLYFELRPHESLPGLFFHYPIQALISGRRTLMVLTLLAPTKEEVGTESKYLCMQSMRTQSKKVIKNLNEKEPTAQKEWGLSVATLKTTGKYYKHDTQIYFNPIFPRKEGVTWICSGGLPCILWSSCKVLPWIEMFYVEDMH